MATRLAAPDAKRAEQTARLGTHDRREARGLALRPRDYGIGFVDRQASQVTDRVSIGAADDPREREADRIANALTPASPALAWPAHAKPVASQIGLDRARVRSGGTPLGQRAQDFYETSLGVDLAKVRVHSGEGADLLARSMSARAFSYGEHIWLGAGSDSGSPSHTLSHEIAHAAQHLTGRDGGTVIRRQSAPAAGQDTTEPSSTATGPTPATVAPAAQSTSAAVGTVNRRNYVFIMGPVSNAFYRVAERFYRAREPDAVMVLDRRSLVDVLDYLHANVTAPAANIYIVAHGAEDGTLAFGLDTPAAVSPGRESPAGHLAVIDLRARLHPASGTSGLADVRAAVDASTRIHIKGCDIGRTGEMEELLDESFGGAGTVTAPTHEQYFAYGGRELSERGRTARREQHDREIAAFSATLPAIPDAPAPVDRQLRGQERTQANAEHARLVRERQAVISTRAASIHNEEVRIEPELQRVEAAASVSEELSGPMFQRVGTTLYTVAELRAQVDQFYPGLSDEQRASLARRLAAPDRRPAATANQQGPYNQNGQRAFQLRQFTQTFVEPLTLAQARVVFRAEFATRRFRPVALSVARSGTTATTTLTGEIVGPGTAPQSSTLTFTNSILSDGELTTRAQATLNNPDRFAWRVEETHANGRTTRTAAAERVVAYLHHETLSPGNQPDFNPAESDARFYTTSVFSPPPPPTAPVPATP